MKILTLNKKQEKKLLELCKEFFPEYKDIELDNKLDDELLAYNQSIIIQFNRTNKIEGKSIHWHQLCLTELPKRIWNKINTKELEGMYFDACQLNATELNFMVILLYDHPIEVIYNFVKLCKKNKYFKV